MTLTTTPELSTLLREGSRAEHTEAEGSSFMSELLAGKVSPAGYVVYLSCLRRIYDALESAAQRLAGDPLVAAVYDPSLERLAALDADLEYWTQVADVPVSEVDSPATDAYVARIEQATAWGGAFLAHHYTRYLGDLSGGQAIGKILARAFELDGDGVAFYAFPGIPKPKPYKDAYRARLDALDLTDEQKNQVLDEVKVVFGLNGALFTELTGRLPEFQRTPAE